MSLEWHMPCKTSVQGSCYKTTFRKLRRLSCILQYLPLRERESTTGRVKEDEMKKIALVLGSMFLAGVAFATPSTTYWTPMTMDIQSYKVPHLGIDNYFTTTKKADPESRALFPRTSV